MELLWTLSSLKKKFITRATTAAEEMPEEKMMPTQDGNAAQKVGATIGTIPQDRDTATMIRFIPPR